LSDILSKREGKERARAKDLEKKVKEKV